MHREATEKVFAESKMKQLGPQGLESAVVWDILVVHVLCVKACNMVWNITHTQEGNMHVKLTGECPAHVTDVGTNKSLLYTHVA